jgi:RecB family endonuclease NucS
MAETLPPQNARPDYPKGVAMPPSASTARFLERDLMRALRAKIGRLESGLKIVDGGTGRTVKYRGTAKPGRIDITAEDRRGATVVIELKRGKAGRRAIGQILGYMGALMLRKKSIRGILVAKKFSPQGVAAARPVPALQLRTYTHRRRKFAFEVVGTD